LVSNEAILVSIGFGVGIMFILIAFFYPSTEVIMRQTENFTIDHNSSRVVPVYLQKGNKLNFYTLENGLKLLNNNSALSHPNLSIKFMVISPTGDNISFYPILKDTDYSYKKSDTFRFVSYEDGFYKLNFTYPANNTEYNQKQKVLKLSMVIEKDKQIDSGSFQTIGSIIIGLSGGYFVSLLRTRFSNYFSGITHPSGGAN
jgi:hypothetical protein